MFGVGVHDTTEEGELDKVEAEVGIFWGEASKEGEVGAVMARLGGGVVMAVRKWSVVRDDCVNVSSSGFRRKG